MKKDIWVLEKDGTWKYELDISPYYNDTNNCSRCAMKNICEDDKYISYSDKDGKIVPAKGHICAAFSEHYISKIISVYKVIPKGKENTRIAIERNAVIPANEIFQEFCKKLCPIKSDDYSCSKSLECPMYNTSFSKYLKVFYIDEN